jgi:hypothetical protein
MCAEQYRQWCTFGGNEFQEILQSTEQILCIIRNNP